MELLLHEYELPLKHPFTISRGTTTAQRTLIVELQQDGVSGYGEAIANTYYDSPMDSMRARLQSVQTMLAARHFATRNRFGNSAPSASPTRRLCCPRSTARRTIFGDASRAPVHRLWGLDPADAVNSSYTIGIAGVEKMVAKLAEMPGWPVYKIKLGTGHDVEIIQALREHTEAVFRDRCQLRLGSG